MFTVLSRSLAQSADDNGPAKQVSLALYYSITKRSERANYDPKTLPTLFFTTPVSICPPRPPIDQFEETMF